MRPVVASLPLVVASTLMLAATSPALAQRGAPPAAPTMSPAQAFARAKIAFDRAEYQRTIDLLRPLLYPEVKLTSEGEMVQAHRMLGVAHLFQQQNDLAAEEFRRLLQLRPDFRMDAFIDPPMVVEFFNDVLEQQEAELAEFEKRRREAEAREVRRRQTEGLPCPEPEVLERRTIRNSRAVSFLPFGAGQFQNGQTRKAWTFFAAETALGAISLGALATNLALYGLRPTLRCEKAEGSPGLEGCSPGYKPGPEKARSELLLRVQVVSGALFFATAIWGVTDAILNFQPEVVVTTPTGGAGGKPEGSAPPAAPRSSSLRVGPTLFPAAGFGGTLAFRF